MAGVFGILLGVAPALGQSTGQINGTVKDAEQRLRSGVEVKATNTGTGSVRSVTTEGNGTYILQICQSRKLYD